MVEGEEQGHSPAGLVGLDQAGRQQLGQLGGVAPAEGPQGRGGVAGGLPRADAGVVPGQGLVRVAAHQVVHGAEEQEGHPLAGAGVVGQAQELGVFGHRPGQPLIEGRGRRVALGEGAEVVGQAVGVLAHATILASRGLPQPCPAVLKA